MKKVLLYSGGMDSYIIAKLHPDAALLYINNNAVYSAREIGMLPLLRGVTVVNNVFDFSQLERDDAIIPSRNLYFVTLAAEYGDRILLASTAGDNSTDKDEAFATQAGALLTHMYSSQHFDRGNITVEMPGKHLSKGQLVSEYVAAGHDVGALVNTVSCYAGTARHCGRCKACVRKWLALESNEIKYNNFITQPIQYDWAGVVKAINSDEGWRCEDEDRYTLEVLKKYGIST